MRWQVPCFFILSGLFAFVACGESVKILVREDRMYAISIGALWAQGANLAGVRADQINLYHAGHVVPIVIDGAYGNLTNDSKIVFWGEFPRGESTPKNPFTRENAYFLQWDKHDTPCRFHDTVQARGVSSSAPIHSIRRTRRIEQDLYHAHYQNYAGAPTDRVMWKKLAAPPRDDPQNSVTFSLRDLDTAAGEEASIRVLLWGTSSLPIEPDHQWSVVLNGTEIGIAKWDSNTSIEFDSKSFPNALLRSDANVLTLKSLLTGKDIDAGLLDWVDVTYTAILNEDSGPLEFAAPVDTDSTIEVVASGNHPRLYSHDGEILDFAQASTSPYQVHMTKEKAQTLWRVASVDTMPAPERVVVRTEGPLPKLADAPDYLIITHAAFMEALKPLIALREQQGLRVAMVNVEDVYDAYAAGMFSAQAIRDYLNELLSGPPGSFPQLKYVFLVGDASYDYFAMRGANENFVPTWHASLEKEYQLPDYSPTLALDDAFTYPQSGEPIPRAAIGRLPAHSIETVDEYVQKVLEYETGPEPQRLRSLVIAAHGYEPFLDQLSKMPLVRNSLATYIHGSGDEKTDATIPDQLLTEFDRGVDMLYFVGHGAYYMWRTGSDAASHKSDVFTSKQVPLLHNRGRYPIVFAATCFSSLFDAPMHDKSYSDSGIGVHLVEASEAGAIAVIGQMSKTTVGAADLFSRETMEALTDAEVVRLGDAFLATKQHSTLRLNAYYRGVALVGDPALFVGQRFHRADS